MKRIGRWLLMGSLLLGLVLGVSTAQAATAPKVKGLILDNARQYYSVASIKQFIDEVHAGGGTFLQLHLTDDTRFGVESAKLGQTVKKAKKVGNTYYNRQTKLAFLSKKQLRSLIVYGHQRQVEVIPEIDTPGHSTALIKLLKTSSAANKKLAKQIAVENDELNLNSAKTKTFVKSLLSEYVGLQYAGKHIAIGGDEYSSSTAVSQPNTVSYTNYLNRYLIQKGRKTAMWNDGLLKADLPKLDHNILVMYWSYDGQNTDPTIIAQHRQIRATLPELNTAGFQTINANSYYLYVVTRAKTFTANNVAFWQQDLLKNWTSNVWDVTNHQDLATSDLNIGSAISIWGDGLKSYSQASVIKRTQPFLKTYFSAQVQ
ncbi:family 20 glycosylhydrolase [Lactiplantibacillus daowaiensis]|uniref:Family 20 glycosylhydrolase n=1 Tax=Lactiplantibacillus daowaiensis TaxID=2559918 RepID=A0ABW1RXE6_9LACO|nr:family 20 glycosylhydrolase [Lactiplantibacillus daowaiensis]